MKFKYHPEPLKTGTFINFHLQKQLF